MWHLASPCLPGPGTWRRPFGAAPAEMGSVEAERATDMMRSLLRKRQQLLHSLTARHAWRRLDVEEAASAARTPAAPSIMSLAGTRSGSAGANGATATCLVRLISTACIPTLELRTSHSSDLLPS